MKYLDVNTTRENTSSNKIYPQHVTYAHSKKRYMPTPIVVLQK